MYSLRFAHLLAALAQPLQSLRIQRPHGPTQIAIHGGVPQVQLGGLVVGKHPRKNRILRQILGGAIGQTVQVLQIVKVGDEAVLPAQRHGLGWRVLQPEVRLPDEVLVEGGALGGGAKGDVEEVMRLAECRIGVGVVDFEALDLNGLVNGRCALNIK